MELKSFLNLHSVILQITSIVSWRLVHAFIEKEECSKEEETLIKVLNEGKPGMLGMIGGEEAEVEVSVKGRPEEEAMQILQNIMDKMGFLAIVESAKTETKQAVKRSTKITGKKRKPKTS
jgi:predicted RNA-binding protein Jag